MTQVIRDFLSHHGVRQDFCQDLYNYIYISLNATVTKLLHMKFIVFSASPHQLSIEFKTLRYANKLQTLVINHTTFVMEQGDSVKLQQLESTVIPKLLEVVLPSLPSTLRGVPLLVVFDKFSLPPQSVGQMKKIRQNMNSMQT